MGASGGLFSVRRELYPEFPDTVQDDFTVSMSVIFQGMRLVKASDVIAYEKTVASRAEALRRKVRIGARAFHTHSFLRPQIVRMSAKDRMKYFSRKMLRWFGGVFITLGAMSGLAAVATVSTVAAALVAAGALVDGSGVDPREHWLCRQDRRNGVGYLRYTAWRRAGDARSNNGDLGARQVKMNDDPPANPDFRALRISYLIQQFPIPTETFAVSDMDALIAQGHHVSVYTLKPPRRRERVLSQSCGVPSRLLVHRPSWKGARTWPKLMRRRGHAALLAKHILPHWRSAPVTCLQALLCIPRILEIAEHVSRSKSDVVHAFWSRHVGLVLPILKIDNVSSVRSAFIGAYDLIADDFIVDMTAEAAEILFSHAEVNRPFLERKVSSEAWIEIVHRGIPLMDAVPVGRRDPLGLVTASALVRSKNVEAVIRGFAEASAVQSGMTLTIYGDGPDRPRLERLAAAANSFRLSHIRRTCSSR